MESPLSLWESVRVRANCVKWTAFSRPCSTMPSPPAPLPKGEGRALLLGTCSYGASRAIVSTNPFTASTLFWNAARSAAVSSTSMIRSTPPAPRITGTPT